MRNCEIYNEAIKQWGKRLQLYMVIEEMSELTKAIVKHFRNGKAIGISEETADVEIMLEQLKIMFNNHEEVEKFKKIKLKRLEDKITKMSCAVCGEELIKAHGVYLHIGIESTRCQNPYPKK